MLFPIAHLPNARVGTLPVLANPFHALADLDPHIVGEGADVLVAQVNRVHHLAIDIHLDLRNRGIADAHGSRPAISLPVFQDLLANIAVAPGAGEYWKRSF